MSKVILFSILLVVVLTPLIISKNREKYLKLMSWVFTLILTLIGFFLTIGNEFFSQFDYDRKRIAKEMFHPQENVNFSDIQANSNKINPNYYFLLDVSGSIKNAPKVKLTDSVKEQIAEINNSGYCPYNGFSFDVSGNDSIKYYRLTQVRAMHSILRLSERHKDTLKYTVVKFATVSSAIPNNGKTIGDIFNEIYDEKYEGEKTDFIALLTYLQNEIKNVSLANRFKLRECRLVFFSDYLHDVDKRDDKYEIEKKLRNFLWDMREKSVYIRLYSPKEIIGKGFPVISLFEDVFPKSVSEVLNEGDELICPIISKTPLPFFYKNSIFEERMTSHLTFDSFVKKKTFSFGLETLFLNDGVNLDNLKQEYYLNGREDTLHLSTNLQPLTFGSNGSVEVMIEGYIPAPYKSPDIIIEDKDEGVRYIIPVTFYKKFPPTGKILLISMLVVLALTILILFGYSISEMIKWGKIVRK